MRHGFPEALVQWFHVETGTFYLSCGEYAILPFDWTAILDLRFGGEPVLTEFVSFTMVSKLFGIPYPITRMIRGYFELTNEP